MTKPELYNRTIEILVQAYLNDTLRHGSCVACAVGNLISSACNYTPVYNNDGSQNGFRWEEASSYWTDVFLTSGRSQAISPNLFQGTAKIQIESTGYDMYQLAKIELAFETAPYGDSDDEWMFNGLMEVINALDQIHGNTDTEVTTTQKNRFTKLPPYSEISNL